MKRYEASIIDERNRLVRCPHCGGDHFRITEQCRLTGKFHEYASCLSCGRGDWLETLQSVPEVSR